MSLASNLAYDAYSRLDVRADRPKWDVLCDARIWVERWRAYLFSYCFALISSSVSLGNTFIQMSFKITSAARIKAANRKL